ncbi:hypothetical protein BC332_16212 [Capsicum chinense]|nr:hypothetical protein BC332_16212 [Capsicum chinense]
MISYWMAKWALNVSVNVFRFWFELVHDRAQVFISCTSDDYEENPKYVGTVARWSNTSIRLSNTRCTSDNRIYILGILSPVYLDGEPLQKWKMLPIPFHNLNEDRKINSVISDAYIDIRKPVQNNLKSKRNYRPEPSFYTGHLSVDEVKDTFLSFRGWSKGVAFINGFNIGRFWPSFGPQCNLYVPAPVLQEGKNLLLTIQISHVVLPQIHKYIKCDIIMSYPDLGCLIIFIVLAEYVSIHWFLNIMRTWSGNNEKGREPEFGVSIFWASTVVCE